MLTLCIVSRVVNCHHKQTLEFFAAQGAVPKIPQSISARKRFEMLFSPSIGEETFPSCAETDMGRHTTCPGGKKRQQATCSFHFVSISVFVSWNLDIWI